VNQCPALILALSCSLASAFGAEIAAPAKFEAVRSFIQEGIRREQTPSVAIAVIRDDEVVWAEGFGFADLERHRPATASSIYLLASVSKPITTTGLMLLVDQGRVELDAPVNRYLPGEKLRAFEGSADGITLRRLLSHTAGLPEHYQFFYEPASPPSREETIRRYGFAYRTPGSRWEYSNLGYGIVDYVISVVAGNSWADFMQDKLYDTLGMKHSGNRVRPGLEQFAARPYRYDVSGQFVPAAVYGFDHDGASTIWSSAMDLSRFLRLHLNDGVLEGKRFFKAGSLRETHVACGYGRSQVNKEQYGLGWFTEPYLGHVSFAHTGGMPGVATRIRGFPEDHAGFVVLLNADAYGQPNARGFREEISERIARAMFNQTGPATEPRAGVTASVPPSAYWGNWIGTLRHYRGEIPLQVGVGEDDKVKVSFRGQSSVNLDKVAFQEEDLSGQMAGLLETQPGFHGIPTLEFHLQVNGDRMTGLCMVSAEDYFALPHWVDLRRKE
jgi:CubicO group peptidase (beta-lactamase class C family)